MGCTMGAHTHLLVQAVRSEGLDGRELSNLWRRLVLGSLVLGKLHNVRGSAAALVWLGAARLGARTKHLRV